MGIFWALVVITCIDYIYLAYKSREFRSIILRLIIIKIYYDELKKLEDIK